jgi:hypothetical protein
MREYLHDDWLKGKADGHQILPQAWRKGGGCEASSTGDDVRNSKMRNIGPCERAAKHRVSTHWHWTGSDEKAEAGGDQIDRRSEQNEQRRADGAGQGIKLEVGRNRPKRRKENCENDGQREGRSARRPRTGISQRSQRERPGDLGAGEGEESKSGRRNGGGQRQASEDQNQTITVLYTNAQSIGGKIDELKVLTQELEPDVILLTETWCNDSVSNAALALENYKLETELRKDRCDTAIPVLQRQSTDSTQ